MFSRSRYAFPVLLSFLSPAVGISDTIRDKLPSRPGWRKNRQLATVVQQIRERGLDTVLAQAEAGSVSACVATKLNADPLGKLISVEGALAESAKVTQLLADLEQLLQQDFSFEQLATTLEKRRPCRSICENITGTTRFGTGAAHPETNGTSQHGVGPTGPGSPSAAVAAKLPTGNQHRLTASQLMRALEGSAR